MNNTLKILVLDNNRMQDKGSIYLAESFKYNHSIKELSVRNNINFSFASS
jgi:Ran GTPase-activating protein (RanGAP) involved in mRNA processing and transport